MNKQLCPNDESELIPNHYPFFSEKGHRLYLSRLVCTKCNYKKEFKIPDILYSDYKKD
jgi:hypothetical protein